MEKIFTVIMDSIAKGGPEAIFTILLVVIGYLVYDRHQLIKTMRTQSTEYKQSLLDVMDKYNKGQMSVVEALNEIKVILGKIEVRVS